MANYFNLILDTTGPAGVSVKINGDESKTTTTAVMLDITCTDADTTGYTMKVWGNIVDSMGYPIDTESSASWQNFSNSLNVVLDPSAEGGSELKTIYVRIRDDVWNESATVSDTITLYKKVPTVNVVSTVSKISKKSTKSWGIFTLTTDSTCDDIKVMVVSDVNASVDDPSNVELFTDNQGEEMTVGAQLLMAYNGSLVKDTEYTSMVRGDYLEKASPGDGVKIIKVFVKEFDGNWSV